MMRGFHGGGGWWGLARPDEPGSQPKISRDLLRRVWAYGSPYRRELAFTLALILMTTLIGLVPPLLYRALIDNALPHHDTTQLALLALGMVALPTVSGLLGVVQRWLSAFIGEGVTADLRRALYEHMQRMSLRFFTNTRTGELMSRLNNDVVGAQQALTSTFTGVITNVVSVVFALAIMLSLDWRLTILGVLVLPLFWLPSQRVAKVLRELTREGLNRNAQMNAQMNETLNVSGALLVKLFGRAPDEARRFGAHAGEVRDIGIRQAVVGRWFMLGISLVSAVGTAIVFWFGGQLVFAGVFTIGTVVAFGSYLTQLYGPLSSLVNSRVQLAQSLVSFERVFEVLDLPVEISDRQGAVDLADVRGEVRFEDVSFSYAGATDESGGLSQVQRWDWQSLARPAGRANGDSPRGLERRAPGTGQADDGAPDGAPASPPRRWALRDVSFEIRPGQLAALVGPSGAGKTTITYLLPRLYDPTEGRILVDGRDLRNLTLASLSRHIGMVTQETYLFHDTIRANLLYARPNATDAELLDACELANFTEVLENMPEGLSTIVGERGYRLSGGEKQRLAIARVILKDPRILVLDEATSSLDSRSEALIQAALERVMLGRTSVVIAHRLSTVLAADVILVLDKGRLVEQGTHAGLLAKGGLYAELYETQFRHLEPTAEASEA